jgi:hypothetical protein
MNDLDWDEWTELTDAQQEAIVAREMAELERRLDAMTIPQQVAHHRHFVLKSIKENRRRLHDPNLARIEIIDQHWRQGIKRSQIRLLKLRVWRATGIYPGATS